MRRVRDPNGVELERAVLQIVDRDASGRVKTCLALYDDETIDLKTAARPGAAPEFLIVWRAGGDKLGNVIPEEAELADALREALGNLKHAKAEIKSSRDLLERVEAEVRDKTAALRALQDERDPRAVEDRVAAAVNAATTRLERELADARATIASMRSEADELRASKRKLREALERAKDGARR